ncbi:hypothetical protein BS47DRAFT_1019529 [Hydnum rufescens UP504]|uniref:Uncharacterized protein n=1 Tax=Hydnum rufescens UP504 TaxID=1448309 RepID=A0A9P6ABD2_9AGAM|nr:hypothetical protein BS47DRAFT_1019529 [Hydnum rufescens UP504]
MNTHMIASIPNGNVVLTCMLSGTNVFGHISWKNTVIGRSGTHDTPSGSCHQSCGVSYPRSSSPPDSAISSSVQPTKPVRMTTMLYWKRHEDPRYLSGRHCRRSHKQKEERD